MKNLLFTAIIASFAALLCSCSGDSDSTLQIGVSLPLSGSIATYGKLALDGVKMKVDEVNEAGGVNGKKIKLAVLDNMGDTAEARNVFRKLASSYKVPVILGPITSSCALAMKKDAEATKIPFVSPTATNDKVTEGNPYAFRACFNDSFQGRILANYAFHKKSIKKAAILIEADKDYSLGLAHTFRKSFIAAGGRITAEETYRGKDTEFGVQLKKIRDSGAELIFIPGMQQEVSAILKQAAKLDIKASFCGSDSWDNETVINGSGDKIEHAFIISAFSLDDTRPQVRNFVERYEKLHNGKKPGTFAVLGYDAATMIIEAFQHGSKPEEVKNALAAIKNIELITGKATVTQEGNLEKSAVILEIEKTPGGKFAGKYKDTVIP